LCRDLALTMVMGDDESNPIPTKVPERHFSIKFDKTSIFLKDNLTEETLDVSKASHIVKSSVTLCMDSNQAKLSLIDLDVERYANVEKAKIFNLNSKTYLQT
jgi:hypothetical protein